MLKSRLKRLLCYFLILATFFMNCNFVYALEPFSTVRNLDILDAVENETLLDTRYLYRLNKQDYANLLGVDLGTAKYDFAFFTYPKDNENQGWQPWLDSNDDTNSYSFSVQAILEFADNVSYSDAPEVINVIQDPDNDDCWLVDFSKYSSRYMKIKWIHKDEQYGKAAQIDETFYYGMYCVMTSNFDKVQDNLNYSAIAPFITQDFSDIVTDIKEQDLVAGTILKPFEGISFRNYSNLEMNRLYDSDNDYKIDSEFRLTDDLKDKYGINTDADLLRAKNALCTGYLGFTRYIAVVYDENGNDVTNSCGINLSRQFNYVGYADNANYPCLILFDDSYSGYEFKGVKDFVYTNSEADDINFYNGCPLYYHVYEFQLSGNTKVSNKLVIQNYFDDTDKFAINKSEVTASDLPTKFAEYYDENLDEVDPLQLNISGVVNIFGIPKKAPVRLYEGKCDSYYDTKDEEKVHAYLTTERTDFISAKKVGNKLDVTYSPVSDLETREFSKTNKSYNYWIKEPVGDNITFVSSSDYTTYNEELFGLIADYSYAKCEEATEKSYSAPLFELNQIKTDVVEAKGHNFNDTFTYIATPSTQEQLDTLIANAVNADEYMGTSLDSLLSFPDTSYKIKRYDCQNYRSWNNPCTNPAAYKLEFYSDKGVIFKNYFDKAEEIKVDITAGHPKLVSSDLPEQYAKYYDENLNEVNPLDITVNDIKVLYGIPKETTIHLCSGKTGEEKDTVKSSLMTESIQKDEYGKLSVSYAPISDLTEKIIDGENHPYWVEKTDVLVGDEKWHWMNNNSTLSYNDTLYYLILNNSKIEPTCLNDGEYTYSAPYLLTTRLADVYTDYYEGITGTPRLEISQDSDTDVIYMKMPEFESYADFANYEGFSIISIDSSNASVSKSDRLLGLATKYDEATNTFHMVYKSVYEDGLEHEYTFEEYQAKFGINPYVKLYDKNSAVTYKKYLYLFTWNYYESVLDKPGPPLSFRTSYSWGPADLPPNNIRVLFDSSNLYTKDFEPLNVNDTTLLYSIDTDLCYKTQLFSPSVPLLKTGSMYIQVPSIDDYDGSNNLGIYGDGTAFGNLSSNYALNSSYTGYDSKITCNVNNQSITVNMLKSDLHSVSSYADALSLFNEADRLVSYDGKVWLKFPIYFGNSSLDSSMIGKKYRGILVPYISNVTNLSKGSMLYEQLDSPIKKVAITALGHDFTTDFEQIEKPVNQGSLVALVSGAENFSVFDDLDLSHIKNIDKQLCARGDAYNIHITYYGNNAPDIVNKKTNVEVVSGNTIEGDLTIEISDKDNDLESVVIDNKQLILPDVNNKIIVTIPADDKEHTIKAVDEAGHETIITVIINKITSYAPDVIDTKTGLAVSSNGIYDGDLNIEVSDRDNDLKTVTIDGVDRPINVEGKVNAIIAADDKEHIIIAIDEAGNRTELNVTVKKIVKPSGNMPSSGHTHILGDTEILDRIEPNCVESGSYHKVVKCKTCGAIVTDELVTLPALGHIFKDNHWMKLNVPVTEELFKNAENASQLDYNASKDKSVYIRYCERYKQAEGTFVTLSLQSCSSYELKVIDTENNDAEDNSKPDIIDDDDKPDKEVEDNSKPDISDDNDKPDKEVEDNGKPDKEVEDNGKPDKKVEDKPDTGSIAPKTGDLDIGLYIALLLFCVFSLVKLHRKNK